MKDDGSIRLYNLPETKVCKAVRGLGSDVSSIAWVHPSGTEVGSIWIAAGRKVLELIVNPGTLLFTRYVKLQIHLFSWDAQAMIQDASHSLVSLDGIISPEDVFNEVTTLDYVSERVFDFSVDLARSISVPMVNCWHSLAIAVASVVSTFRRGKSRK